MYVCMLLDRWIDLLSFLKVIFKKFALKFLFRCWSVGTVNGDINVSIRSCSIFHTGSDLDFIRNCNQ